MICRVAKFLLTFQFELGPRRAGLGGRKLCLRLIDGCLLRHGLLAQTGDGRALYGDLVLCGLHS